MALTINEQLKLTSGQIKPSNCDLIVLVHQAALITSKRFYDKYKEFDPALTPLAQSYLNKVFSVCDKVIRKDSTIIQQILGMTIVIIGDSEITLEELQAGDSDVWENFILEQMDEVFEYVAGVKREEKKIYKELKKDKDKK